MATWRCTACPATGTADDARSAYYAHYFERHHATGSIATPAPHVAPTPTPEPARTPEPVPVPSNTDQPDETLLTPVPATTPAPPRRLSDIAPTTAPTAVIEDDFDDPFAF